MSVKRTISHSTSLVHVHFVIKEERRLILVLNEEWVPDEGIGLSASHLLHVTASSCCFCSHLINLCQN